LRGNAITGIDDRNAGLLAILRASGRASSLDSACPAPTVTRCPDPGQTEENSRQLNTRRYQ
jgi:hypothetical protein